MTPAEAQGLLTVAAAFDNRKPDEAAAQAWAMALGDLPFYDCRDAIVRHYQASGEWVMPAKVIADVKRVRAKRLEDHTPLTPPRHDCPSEDCTCEEFQRAWLKEARRRVANGEVIDCDAAYGELKPRNLPDLKALIQKPERNRVAPLLWRRERPRRTDG